MLKQGRIVALVLVTIAACALTLNARDDTKKQDAKKESNQKTTATKSTRAEHWQVGDGIGTIEKVDAEKKTITLKDDVGKVQTGTIDVAVGLPYARVERLRSQNTLGLAGYNTGSFLNSG